MLLARDAHGDRERASELIDEARELARTFEMTRLETKLDRLTGAGDRVAEAPPARVRERARVAASDAKAAVTVRGRAAFARALGDATDAELERRFGSPLAQKAIFAAMTRGFQPRLAYGFEGEIAIELQHTGVAASQLPDWWTLCVRGSKATATRGPARDPAVTLHATVPVFIRLASGQDTPLMAALYDRAQAEGDLLLGMRLTEMFGAVNPADVLRAGG
jgi:putative sterol carrier protein